ncbi:MAG: GNAT family N-acetyltransferase [Anaerolineae bacterium]|nr:GNAT family N-acetyltransferase [Anaerolineae bacterium]
MAAARVVPAQRSFSGLRPFNARRDLGDVADLIETCFAATLDARGRAAIQEMRLLHRIGPLGWLVGRLSRAIPPLGGFVWVESGQVVGNVSTTPTGGGRGWIIANVAVYPAYRRQGIARQLMRAALDWTAQNGRFAVLQVEADNGAARALYEDLGFRELRTFTRWRRAAHYRQPEPESLRLQPVTWRDRAGLVALAEQVRPNDRGGMGWLRPTRQRDLRPVWGGGLGQLLGGQQTGYWIVPGPDQGEPAAALRIERRAGGLTTVFDLLVRPDRQGQIEPALVNALVYRWGARRHPLVTEHPADDWAASAAFEQHYFRPERTLVHMRLEF